MRKYFLFLVLIVVAATFSCKKGDLIAETEENDSVVIKMSIIAQGLKGVSVMDTMSFVVDTILMSEKRSSQIIFSAERSQDDHTRVDGTWEISLVDTDDDEGFVLARNLGIWCEGSITSLKPTELGLYSVRFISKRGVVVQKYIKHVGIPGEIGDDGDADFSFRVNKPLFRNDRGDAFEGFTVFVKIYPGEFDEFSKIGNWNINYLSNYFAIVNHQKKFSLKKSKYATTGEYLCFSFSGTTVSDNEYYIDFGFGGVDHYTRFKSSQISAWSTYGTFHYGVF